MGNKGGKPEDGQSTPAAASTTTTTTTTAATSGEPVLLLVYEPAEATMGMPGFGVYHTGLQVYGAEYSFAGNGTRATGVYSQRPRYCPPDFQWRYKEEVKLGYTSLTKTELKQLVAELSAQFAGNMYHVTGRNCNHFTEAFTTALGLAYPAWVNRAARVGHSLGLGDQGAGGSAAAQSGAATARPVDVAPKAVENRDLVSTGAVEVAQVACLNGVGRGAAIILDPKRPKGAILQSDSDEQLLIFIPLKRICKLHTMMIAIPVGARQSNSPHHIKLFKNRLNLNFDDASSAPPASCERVDLGALLAKEMKDGIISTTGMTPVDGFKWVTIPLRFVAWQDVSHLTVFVEDNHGADTSMIGGLSLIGQDPAAT